ncbi:MAG: hypothetical protein NTW28_08635, partial [Candidatus Solibacter sp.]|nr:hypothetical protein [Candidatus Solibacter sp.]
MGIAELVFEVVQEADGAYRAECLTENIFTEGDTWQQLRENVLEATAGFFFDQPRPERIRPTWSVMRSCPSHEDPPRRLGQGIRTPPGEADHAGVLGR